MDPEKVASIAQSVPPPSLGFGASSSHSHQIGNSNAKGIGHAFHPVIHHTGGIHPNINNSNNPSVTATNSNSNVDTNEFEFDDDDDWDDEELAKIDLKVMTQSASAPLSRNNSASTSNNIQSNPNITAHATTSNSFTNQQYASASSVPQNNASSEFSDDDDDFAGVDFAALDNKITQHQQLMTQAMDHTSHNNHHNYHSARKLPMPPPPGAPIHNRKATVDLTSTSSPHAPEPTYLSFSRYVIRMVEDDTATFTKTIAVGVWTPKEELGNKSEIDRLKKICEEDMGVSNSNNLPTNAQEIDGCMHLRGEWYHTQCHIGDVIHLCSISGRYVTDKSALPVVLDTTPPEGSDREDDLLLVIHPDVLISPTLISEAVKCPRLAVLQSRLGSTGLSAKSAVIGTLRHDLFERCLREHDASQRSAVLFTRQILRNHAETLLGCGIIDQGEAFKETLATLPQIQQFLNTYTTWNTTSSAQTKLTYGESGTPTAVLDGIFASGNTLLSIEGVYSTEEWAMVPELGLKGNVDATVLARTRPVNSTNSSSPGSGVQESLMPLELKTGHVQTPQQPHQAQLSVYTMMLRARHGSASQGFNGINRTKSMKIGEGKAFRDGEEKGAASSGMLLYLNQTAFLARHVKPLLNEARSLIGQRNRVVCDALRTSRPRGIKIEYEHNAGGIKSESKVVVDAPPPSNLPPLLQSTGTCERCYKNRECMMYSSADKSSTGSYTQLSSTISPPMHNKLVQHFTSHLDDADLEYFRKWDRLIDLEKHASATEIAKSWLFESSEKEANDRKCIGGMLLDEALLAETPVDPKKTDQEDNALIRFHRSNDHGLQTPLHNLGFETGSYVIISTDGTSFSSQHQSSNPQCKTDKLRSHYRHKMHLLRGTVNRVMGQSIEINIAKKEITRIKRLIKSGLSSSPSSQRGSGVVKFRIDKDELSGGAGYLLQNLVNFFTLDIPSFSAESFGQTPAKTKSLTCNSENSFRRRKMNSFIVRLSPKPCFRHISEDKIFSDVSFSQGVPGCSVEELRRDFDKLNSDQKGAVLKVISAEDFTLIQGLPGTGKSATIAFLTRLLVASGKRVMLTSYTHSAVDNLILKLMESEVNCAGDAPSPIIRIGRETSCHPKVHSLLAQNVAYAEEKRTLRAKGENYGKPSVNNLHKVMSAAKIVGVSALSAPRSPLLAGQHFDYVIVDEAGQISQPAILGAIMAADSFVLVGDHMQLPPLVCSEVAEEAGYGVSMLKRLAEGFPEAVAILTMQYRMHEHICDLSNKIAYGGLLKCGNNEVRYGTLEFRNFPPNPSSINPVDRNWLEKAIAPDRPVIFLDTDGMSTGPGQPNFKGLESEGPINDVELCIAQRIIQALTISGLDASSIGVITPFRSQLRMLNEDIVLQQYKNDGLELCTIDRFQGRDKPVVIFSLVRSNKEGKCGRLLQDFRRLNVAFSRAKQKLIMMGSLSTLKRGNDVMRPVLDHIEKNGWVQQMNQIS